MSNQSWTDSLQVCTNTGVGFSLNQVYREDGNHQEEHYYEDCKCSHQFSPNCFYYAIFDGHGGSKIAKFCSEKLTAELYFAQIKDDSTDDVVQKILREVFFLVETEYMESVGSLSAERTILMEDIKGLTAAETSRRFPDVVEKLRHINSELSSGTACAVGLILNNKLYVANVGDCRVLLCQTDENDVMKVVELSVEHNLKNHDELLRLSQLGLDVNLLKNASSLGNQSDTRCLGNYLVKGCYKEFKDLAPAVQEPITAEPDINGGIPLDESCKFLLMMTSGLLKTVEEVVTADQVNKYIAQCVVEQFREQTTLDRVAQGVIDKIVRLHHDRHMSDPARIKNREDNTLMVRNLNFPLHSNTNYSTYDSVSVSQTLFNSMNNVSSTSSSGPMDCQQVNGLGPDQKIKGYVDFNDFYVSLEKAKKEGRCPEWMKNL
ncbi:TGF-beta-activated kinase 1 and MAP3K7-binding protein 1-like [Coccinella septempunctata]|uniref:TGF-beta-activated kinase 1 and MAP3K7-binding protein 1-like n=1 Tax=Coccinella septempunctata TaxID=41139 RepID=UPI001D068435|nr:TGF-beta-activated kinase 1 and MAP3K7-binding protein 1-like [Coccinella septempunctata]